MSGHSLVQRLTLTAHSSPGSAGKLMSLGLSLACLVLIASFALLHRLAPHAYLFITRLPDGMAKPHPFVDLHDILQAGACWRHGVNVYTPSPCLGGGVFNYSPLLLRLAYLPIGPADTLAGGLIFCTAYAAALAALPAPSGWGEFSLRAAAAFSPAAYYALEQGNFDTLIFAASILGLRLLPWQKAWAYAIFALCAAAKFYPVALFALALVEQRRVLLGLSLALLAALCLCLMLDLHGLLAALHLIPSGTPFRASFGRIDLPRGLAMKHILPRSWASAASWGMVFLALAIAAWRRTAWAHALATLERTRANFLIAGAMLTLFCFMAAQNIEYRGLFLLLTLPGLTCLTRLGLSFRLLPWLVTLLLWEALPRAALLGLVQPYLPLGPGFGFWLLRESLWWLLIIEFLSLALAFVTHETQRLAHVKIDVTGQNP